jgi:hypothetical protein
MFTLYTQFCATTSTILLQYLSVLFASAHPLSLCASQPATRLNVRHYLRTRPPSDISACTRSLDLVSPFSLPCLILVALAQSVATTSPGFIQHLPDSLTIQILPFSCAPHYTRLAGKQFFHGHLPFSFQGLPRCVTVPSCPCFSGAIYSSLFPLLHMSAL